MRAAYRGLSEFGGVSPDPEQTEHAQRDDAEQRQIESGSDWGGAFKLADPDAFC